MPKTTILAALILAAACDAPATCPTPAAPAALAAVEPLERHADDVELRQQGEPWSMYIPQALHLDEWSAIAEVCGIDQPLTVSLSGWLPDVAKQDEHVVGYHFSMTSPEAMKECLVGVMDKHGAVTL